MISSINVMMTGDLHTFFCVSKKNLKMFSCPSDGARLQYRMEHAENAAACASWSEEALPASHIGCGLPTGWDQPSDERNKVPIFGYSKKWFVYHQILAKSHGKSKHHDFFLENIMSFFGESEINSFLIKKIFFGETSCHFRAHVLIESLKQLLPKATLEKKGASRQLLLKRPGDATFDIMEPGKGSKPPIVVEHLI